MRRPAKGKMNVMKGMFLIFLAAALAGCTSPQASFGEKMCAVYGNYDSAARHLRAHLAAHPEPSEDWMFLGVAEMHRGRIPEMHAAWAQAEKAGPFPELLLVRADRYIESGEPEKAEADLVRLKELLARKDLSVEPNYYRFLLVRRIPNADHDRAWREIRAGKNRQFLRSAADALEKKLARLEKTPGRGLFSLRRISDPAWQKIVFGMTEKELRKCAGTPQKEGNTASPRRRILVYFRDGAAAGFLFSPETARLGDVRVSPVCGRHGAENMRLAKTADFDWVCLACLAEKNSKDNGDPAARTVKESQKTSRFSLEKEGARGKENLFSREKRGFPSPGISTPLSETKRFTPAPDRS